MQKWLLLMGLAVTTALSAGGCRSCSNCHDYGPPVANCDCNGCGCERAGSASGGYVSSEYEAEEYVVEPPADGPSMQEASEQDTPDPEELP